MPSDSTPGVNSISQHDQYYIRSGDVCFLVQNTAFRLHRYFFERESDYFHERLRPASTGEDGSPDSPYIIRDVTSDDFADFVWVWYKPRYTFAKQDKKKWLTILRLATLWRFHEIRNLAIHHLEKVNFEPIERITTYREYSVDNKLLLPSYMSLCSSPTLPSPEEGKRLTLETVLMLAKAREQVLLRASELGCRTPTIASAPEDIIMAVVAEIFDLTLHSNDDSVRVDGHVTYNEDVPTVKEPAPNKKPKVNGDVSQPQNTSSQNGVGAGTGKGKQKPTKP